MTNPETDDYEAEVGDEMFMGVQATAAELRIRLHETLSDQPDMQQRVTAAIDQWMREQVARQREEDDDDA